VQQIPDLFAMPRIIVYALSHRNASVHLLLVLLLVPTWLCPPWGSPKVSSSAGNLSTATSPPQSRANEEQTDPQHVGA
jgi:hypothetical protein